MVLSVTKADILSFSPCASDSIARIDELFAGRESLTAADVIALNMPDEHKLWLILRPQLIPQDRLDAISTEFRSMISGEDFLERAKTATPIKLVTFVLLSLRPSHDDNSTDPATLARLLEIVRSHL